MLQCRFLYVRPAILKHNFNTVNKFFSLSPTTYNVSGKDDKSLWVASPYPEIKPVVGLTVPELIREVRGPWGKLPAFGSQESGRTYSHDEILDMSRGFAAALMKSGFGRREVVSVMVPNIPEYASILFGIWDAGLIVSPLNPVYAMRELSGLIEISGAVCLVVIPANVSIAQEIKKSNPKIRSIVVVGEAPLGCHSFYEMSKADTQGVEFFKGSSIDTTKEIAILPFSSGTTGPPKGVMLSHSNLATNLVQCQPGPVFNLNRYVPGGPQETFIAILPFFHTYGLFACVHQALFVGAHVRCFQQFEPVVLLKGIREHKPTVWHLVTPLISHIVNWSEYGKSEFESCRVVVGGAAPIGKVLLDKLCVKAAKDIVFQEGYGLTETSPATHILNTGTKKDKIGSCGHPVSNTLTKLVDSDGNTVGRNTPGELWVKGPQVMLGYYKNEKATKETINSEGWMRTGDIGVYDDEGFLYIVDRVKELIKVQGLQVAPSELEDLLRKHEKILDVAVVGVPDEKRGEAPRAYIVKKPEAKLTEKEIHSFMEPLISKHKRLMGGVEFIDTIPKAASGKILRRVLQEDYASKHKK